MDTISETLGWPEVYLCDKCGRGFTSVEIPEHTCEKIPFEMALKNLTRWLGRDRALELLADAPEYRISLMLYNSGEAQLSPDLPIGEVELCE